MKRKLFFLLVAAIFLAPWPVAHAYGEGPEGDASLQVEAADPAAAPHLTAYGHAIGSVTPGDLFYIDTSNATADIPVSLHITNTGDLVHAYRYMNLNVGVYAEKETDQWEKMTTGEAGDLPVTYITMQNSAVRFTLPGYSRYKITIENGCFYCYGTKPGGEAVLPSFYLSLG